MKLKFNNVLKTFKNIFKKNNNENLKDFLKNKNKILIVFAAFFAIFIATIFVSFSLYSSPREPGLGEKTIISIPTKKELTSSELFEIKNTASSVLKTNCSVQQTANEKELNIIDEPQQIKINLTSFFKKNTPQTNKKIEQLTQNLNKNHPNILNIKNKNDIVVENYFSYDFLDYLKNFLLIVSTILIIVLIYFLIAYKKINGFLSFLSFFAGLILNILMAAAFFSVLIVSLNLQINSNFVLKFATFLIMITLNLFLNSCTIFNSFKKTLFETNNPKDALNETLNKNNKTIFNNVLIFSVIPCFCFLVFSLLNNQFNLLESLEDFVLAAIILACGVLCRFTSIYFIPNFIMLFKSTKKPKKEVVV